MTIPHIKKVYFEDDFMILESQEYKTRIPLKLVSRKLLNATETDRAVFTLSPSGYTIMWTTLEVSLAISQLLAKFGSAELVEKMMKKKE